jgi:hypothetical protein
MKDQPAEPETPRSEFAQAIGRGLLIGAAALVLILPPYLYFRHRAAPAPAAQPAATAKAPAAAKPQHVIRHADFGAEPASPDAHRMANWVADSHDNGTHSFVVIDKHDAKVFLFDGNAHLQAAAPTVIGSAIGDDTYPGVGDKPLAALKPYERTTPAGRFVAEVGETSSRHEDVVWVDYDNAVSMHRIIKVPVRLKAIETPTPEDNRLSNGCINLPDAFYEKALRPAVDRYGVVVYIIPETRPIQQTFASFYDVDAPGKLAQN